MNCNVLGLAGSNNNNGYPFNMDHEYRFEHLVGMIYEAVPTNETLSLLVDAISAEVESMGSGDSMSESQRRSMRSYVSRSAHRYADLEDANGHDRVGDLSDLFSRDATWGWRTNADRLMLRLSNHLARSATLRNRFRELEEQYCLRRIEQAHLSVGMVWVSADLKVVALNREATAQLQGGNGLTLRDGRIGCAVRTDEFRLDEALRAAVRSVEPKSKVLAILRSAHALPILLSVLPVALPDVLAPGSRGTLALVILRMRSEPLVISLAHLQGTYGLTPAEIRMAEALANNQTLEHFAERSGISRATARSHLARVFSKTGTSRQAELVRLLVLLGASM